VNVPIKQTFILAEVEAKYADLLTTRDNMMANQDDNKRRIRRMKKHEIRAMSPIKKSKVYFVSPLAFFCKLNRRLLKSSIDLVSECSSDHQ
jgi:hypothetical protein